MEREPDLKINSKLTVSQVHQLFGRCQVTVDQDAVRRYERERAARYIRSTAAVVLAQCIVKVEKDAPVEAKTTVRKKIHTSFPGPSCSTMATVGSLDGMDTKRRIRKENSRHQGKFRMKATVAKAKRSRNQNRMHKGRHSCLFCEKVCRSWSCLEIHMRVHTDERPFVCDLCPASFAHHGHLKGHHVAVHSKAEKKFSCGHCGKRFRRNQGLNSHKATHSSERPFSCNLCGKSFRHKTSLEIHLRSHTGERPYKCEVCQKRFITASLLKSHKFTHGPTALRPYKCSRCPKTFCQKYKLKDHVNRHTGNKPYTCGVCQKAYSSSSALRLHRRTKGHRPAGTTSREATSTE